MIVSRSTKLSTTTQNSIIRQSDVENNGSRCGSLIRRSHKESPRPLIRRISSEDSLIRILRSNGCLSLPKNLGGRHIRLQRFNSIGIAIDRCPLTIGPFETLLHAGGGVDDGIVRVDTEDTAACEALGICRGSDACN